MTQKTCHRCTQEKPLTDFAKNRSKPDGRQSECRLCRRKIVPPGLKKLRADSAIHADNSRRPWTPEDDKVVMDPAHSLSAAAALLGRGYGSVSERRRLLRKKG